MLAVKFFIDVFTLLRKFLFILSLLSIFIMKKLKFGCFFWIIWDGHVVFPFFICMCCINITDLYNEPLFHSWNKSHLVMLYIFLYLVVNILLRIFNLFYCGKNMWHHTVWKFTVNVKVIYMVLQYSSNFFIFQNWNSVPTTH